MKILLRMESVYVWECPKCRVENYERPVPAELTPNEKEEMEKEIAAAPGYAEMKEMFGGGEWYTRPDDVQCTHCLKEFEVDVMSDGLDGESDDD